MAEIPHSVATVTTEQTYNTDTNYVDISGAEIASGNFTAGRKYLIVATAQCGVDNVDTMFGTRLMHGSTPFADSEQVIQTNQAGRFHFYQWFTVWTAVSSEAVKMQHKVFNTANIVKTDLVKIVAIEISEQLSENTDWFYNEVLTDEVIPTDGSWETANNASITFIPGAGDDWLVLATARYTGTDIARQTETRIARSGEASDTDPMVSVEGESTGDAYMHTLARTYNLGAASNTFTLESRNEAGSAVSTTRTGNQIFALNLAKFKNHQIFYDNTESALSGTSFATQTHTKSITPTVTGDVWALAFFVDDVNNVDGGINLRLQKDNVDDPAGQTADNNGVVRRFDTTDEFPGMLQTVANVTTGGSTFDVDMNRIGAVADVEDRLLVLVTMELAAAGPVTKTVTDSMSLSHQVKTTKTVRIIQGITQSDTVKTLKTILLLDSLSLGHLLRNTKTVLLSDSIIQSETVSVVKNVLKTITDSLSFSDSVKVSKVVRILQSISLSEFVSKTVTGSITKLITDSLSLSHQVRTTKTIIIQESIQAASVVLLSKLVRLSEAFGISETVSVVKSTLTDSRIFGMSVAFFRKLSGRSVSFAGKVSGQSISLTKVALKSISRKS